MVVLRRRVVTIWRVSRSDTGTVCRSSVGHKILLRMGRQLAASTFNTDSRPFPFFPLRARARKNWHPLPPWRDAGPFSLRSDRLWWRIPHKHGVRVLTE
jgi:hypothetical protein